MRKKTREEINKKSFKNYVRDYLLFTSNYLGKKIGIFLVIAIFLSALSLKPIVDSVINDACIGTCKDNVGILYEYIEKLKIVGILALSGIVPYIYVPAVGFIGCTMEEVTNFSYIIKGYGYLKGILVGIVPFIINILCISVIAALGVYICKTITLSYKMTSLNNMNFLNFRIKFYEAIGNEKRQKELKEKKEKKLKNIENKKEKLKYIQIINTLVVVCILQFISVLIQEILL